MQPVDHIVLVLAGAIAFGVIATVVAQYITKQPISDQRSAELRMIVMAIIAIISTYVGAKLTP